MIVLYILGAIFLISTILILYEIKHAPLIPSDVPFLHDDYVKEVDPTKKYFSIFCDHCTKNIDGLYCNNGKHIRKIDKEMIEECKVENYFKAK
jgi:hypothetical protein